MARGRQVGTTEVSLVDIKKIIDMTQEGYTRREIANSVNRAMDTIYRYQVKYKVL